MANWSPGSIPQEFQLKITSRGSKRRSELWTCAVLRGFYYFHSSLGSLGSWSHVRQRLFENWKCHLKKNGKGKKLPTSTIGGCQVVPNAQYTGQSRTMVRQTCVNHGAPMIFMSGIENAIQLWSFLFLLDQTPITNHPKDTPPPEHGMLKWKSPL